MLRCGGRDGASATYRTVPGRSWSPPCATVTRSPTDHSLLDASSAAHETPAHRTAPRLANENENTMNHTHAHAHTHTTPRTTHHAPHTTHHAPRTTHHTPHTTHHTPHTTHHTPHTTPHHTTRARDIPQTKATTNQRQKPPPRCRSNKRGPTGEQSVPEEVTPRTSHHRRPAGCHQTR